MTEEKKSLPLWGILLGVGALLAICCLVVVLAVVFLYPSIREGSLALLSAPTAESLASPSPDFMLTASSIAALFSEPPATGVPAESGAPTPGVLFSVDYNGIAFYFAPGVAQNALPETIPAAAADPNEAFPGSIYPQHFQFKFEGYPLKGTFHEAHILVYPAEPYAAMDPGAAQVIQELKQLLSLKPASPQRIPFLPIWNAAQMMRSNIEYINFQDGEGVRFLTQYGQAFYPVNNNDLFYTFQGLSADGQWYLAAVLPVSHPMLPNDQEQIPGGDFEAFANNFESYKADIQQKLYAQPDSTFIPDLSLLDALFQSMKVK